MTPPEELHRYQEQIGAFLLGKLDGVELAAMQTHLDSCPVCQAEVRELEPVVAALADAAPDRIDEEPLPPGDLEELTLAPILGKIHRAQRRRRQLRWAAPAAAAICAVVIGLAVLEPEVSLAEDGARLEVRTAGGELVFFAKLAVGPQGADPGSPEGRSAEKSDPADTQKKPKAAGSGGETPHKGSPPARDAKRPSPGGVKPVAVPEASEPGNVLHGSPPPASPPPASPTPASPAAADQY